MEAIFHPPQQADPPSRRFGALETGKSLAIPAGREWKAIVVKPIPVKVTLEGEGVVAKWELIDFGLIRDTPRRALLDLRIHVELLFLELSLAAEDNLTEKEKQQLPRLQQFLEFPQEDVGPLSAEDKIRVSSWPEEELSMVLERQARLCPPIFSEGEDG